MPMAPTTASACLSQPAAMPTKRREEREGSEGEGTGAEGEKKGHPTWVGKVEAEGVGAQRLAVRDTVDRSDPEGGRLDGLRSEGGSALPPGCVRDRLGCARAFVGARI